MVVPSTVAIVIVREVMPLLQIQRQGSRQAPDCHVSFDVEPVRQFTIKHEGRKSFPITPNLHLNIGKATSMPNWTYNAFKSMERNWQSFAATSRIAVTRHSSKEERDHYKREHRAFIVRWVNTGFDKHFGTNTNNLEAWKSICETIGIEGARDFSSISQCKKVRNDAR